MSNQPDEEESVTIEVPLTRLTSMILPLFLITRQVAQAESERLHGMMHVMRAMETQQTILLGALMQCAMQAQDAA